MAITRNHALAFLGLCAGAALPVYGYLASRAPANRTIAVTSADAIVVGAGIAGLSAAYELANGGASVIVVDTASIFGGHAVMATGDLTIVGTPFQEAHGQKDSVELALADFQKWGEDPDPTWIALLRRARAPEVYDWLDVDGRHVRDARAAARQLGLRTHRTKGRGIGLVSPIFSACARRPNLSFRWNTRVRSPARGGRARRGRRRDERAHGRDDGAPRARRRARDGRLPEQPRHRARDRGAPTCRSPSASSSARA